MPRQSGSATRNTTRPAAKSLVKAFQAEVGAAGEGMAALDSGIGVWNGRLIRGMKLQIWWCLTHFKPFIANNLQQTGIPFAIILKCAPNF